MSSIFQGFCQADGRLKTVVVATPPAGSAIYRGILLDSEGQVCIKTDSGGITRAHVGGLAVEASTGIVLHSGTATPFVSIPGAIQTDQNGAMSIKAQAPDLVHQGVGMLNNGTICVTAAV